MTRIWASRDVAKSSEGHVYAGPLENGHWVDASELQAGDRLLTDDGAWVEVVGVEVQAEPLTAFNLTVAEFLHTSLPPMKTQRRYGCTMIVGMLCQVARSQQVREINLAKKHLRVRMASKFIADTMAGSIMRAFTHQRHQIEQWLMFQMCDGVHLNMKHLTILDQIRRPN